MTEYEMASIAAIAFQNGVSTFAVFFSVVTAYLIAAHTAGRRLSRTQVCIVNTCYFMAAIFFGGFAIVFFMRGLQMARAAREISTIDALYGTRDITWIWPALLVVFVVSASYYFMWSVRRGD